MGFGCHKHSLNNITLKGGSKLKAFFPTRGRCSLFIHFFVLSLCLLLGTSCGTQGGGGKVTIVGRGFSAQINPGATQDVLAHCQTGEQMVGGGYNTEQPAGPDQAVAVEASFPDSSAAPMNWHVTFFNPSDTPATVVALVYCLTSPTPVSVSVIQDNSKESHPDPFVLYTDSAQCASGSTLLSGGFRVDHHPEAGEQTQNAGVVRSKPLLDANGQANGWSLTVVSYDLPHNLPLTSTVYALCASTVLKPAPAVKSDPTPFRVAGIVEDHTSSCGANQLTIGGGFEFLFSGQQGEFTFPKSVYNNEALGNLTAWQAKANSVPGLAFQAWAACFLLPAS
jgi:hypothetical protein